MKRVYRIVLAEGGVRDEFLILAESFEEAANLAKRRSLLGYLHDDAEIESIVELGALREERE